MQKLYLLLLLVLSSNNAAGNETFKCGDLNCSPSHYLAGFAKVDISPRIGVDKVPTLAAAPQLVKQIHDPLYAKSLVLSDGQLSIGFVALDLCFLLPESIDELRQYLEQESDHAQIILTVTHTHSGMFDQAKLSTLKARALDALKSASKDLQAVMIGAKSINVDEAYNRRIQTATSIEMLWANPERIANRPVDTALGVIHLRSLQGKPLVSIVNYSAHPTVTMDLEHVVVSADYPGAIASTISERLGGEVLFLAGAAGDVNPYNSDTKPIELAIKKSTAMGTRLGLAAIKAIHSISNYEDGGEFKLSKRSFSNPNAEISALLLTPNIAMATFPGEYFNSFGEQLKSQSPVDHTFFIGYSNGSIGYVPTETAAKLGGYGADIDSEAVQGSSTTGRDHTRAAIEMIKQLNGG
ncbi:MAG: neutral ceramidase [Cryomorphaceae bacterium]